MLWLYVATVALSVLVVFLVYRRRQVTVIEWPWQDRPLADITHEGRWLR